MKFLNPLIEGKIIKRYKRFLADVEMKGGQIVTAHIANTGSMKTCWEPGWKVLMSFHDNPKRKLKYSLEMIHNGQTWIGVNTALPNKLAKEAIEKGVVKELRGFSSIKAEVKTGKSRLDLLLSQGEENEPKKSQCYVEIKNVTLRGEEGPPFKALFPDAKSERAQKHVLELIRLQKEGYQTALLFIVQREDVQSFSPAEHIDPIYSELLKKAKKNNVNILAYQCTLSEEEIVVAKKMTVKIN